ncbi:MAG: CoA transferase [Spirochaetaceae bacterium]|nr:CoA transferase [Spirochaetaceae bacterium]HPG26322.1 CoA transferase [Myxococcota bacterium]
MPGPLAGVRIVEVSEVISAPLGVMLLAEQGAEVVKVEPPRHGEESRQLSNYRDGMAALFLNNNHGKRSIGVDLKRPEGRALVLELVRRADVFVQNWRPGTAERLGLGEAALRAVNPELVYASVSGFGEDGPYARRRGYDPIFQSLTGYVAAQLNPEVPIPDLVRNAVVDKATAYALAQAITAALFARERGAPGQHVRLNMLDAGLAFFWPDGMLRHSLVGDDVANYAVPGERYALSPTKDGQIVFWASTAEQMRATLRVVSRDDLADSPGQQGRAMIEEANQLARAAAVAEGLSRMTTADAYRRMIDLEVPAAPILGHPEVLVDPQIVHNGAVIEAVHPVYGRYRRVRSPARFSASVADPIRPAPLYGEDTDAILEDLGHDAAERERLRALGVVR